MEPTRLGTNDLLHHVMQFGIDVFPPIEIHKERTRLNMFYEEARSRWDDLFEKLVTSDTEFRISKEFVQRPGIRGASRAVDTFVLTQRGPVLSVPVLLPEPVGETGLERAAVERFREVRSLFFSGLGDRKIMRVGLIRELLFGTGELSCQHLLATQTTLSDAELVGGKRLLVFRDRQCNVRLEFGPVEITQTEQLPVGARVERSAGYGVQVRLDVNNSETRPLADADIEAVLERAGSLWPDELLKYLNERSTS